MLETYQVHRYELYEEIKFQFLDPFAVDLRKFQDLWTVDATKFINDAFALKLKVI